MTAVIPAPSPAQLARRRRRGLIVMAIWTVLASIVLLGLCEVPLGDPVAGRINCHATPLPPCP